MQDPNSIVYDKLDPTSFRYRISKLLGVRIPKMGYGKIIKELETKGAFDDKSQTALIVFVLQYLEDLENAFKYWTEKVDQNISNKIQEPAKNEQIVEILVEDMRALTIAVQKLKREEKKKLTSNEKLQKHVDAIGNNG